MRIVGFWATLLALVRPEGSLLAIITVGVLWTLHSHQPKLRKSDETQVMSYSGISPRLWLLMPIIAIGVQPMVNWFMTGSAVASGNAAKSVFGMLPFYWDEVLRRIAENFIRIWVEFGTGNSPREGLYIAPLLLLLAIVGIVRLLLERKWRPVGVILIGWLVAGTLMIATLDTAFWHFKRYQMPFMALLYPLAGWGLIYITTVCHPPPLKTLNQ